MAGFRWKVAHCLNNIHTHHAPLPSCAIQVTNTHCTYTFTGDVRYYDDVRWFDYDIDVKSNTVTNARWSTLIAMSADGISNPGPIARAWMRLALLTNDTVIMYGGGGKQRASCHSTAYVHLIIMCTLCGVQVHMME